MDTGKPATTAEAPQGETPNTIEYYPAEGEEALTVDTEPTEPEGATEPEAAPAAAVPEGAQAIKATSPLPPLPGEPQTPTISPEVLQYRQALAAQAQLQEQQAVALAQLQVEQEANELRTVWAKEGYDDAQIDRGLAQHRQLRSRELAVQASEQRVGQMLAQQDRSAKNMVATIISQKTGMPVAELLKFDNPHVMEAKAEAWKSNQELAKMKQAKVKPTRLANVGPGNMAAQSIIQLKRRYADGGDLTPAQKEAIGLY